MGSKKLNNIRRKISRVFNLSNKKNPDGDSSKPNSESSGLENTEFSEHIDREDKTNIMSIKKQIHAIALKMEKISKSHATYTEGLVDPSSLSKRLSESLKRIISKMGSPEIADVKEMLEDCTIIINHPFKLPPGCVSATSELRGKFRYINPVLDEGEMTVEEPFFPVYVQAFVLISNLVQFIQNSALSVAFPTALVDVLIRLYGSWDKLERRNVTNLLKEIYTRFTPLRTSIRLKCRLFLENFLITEDATLRGVEEILELVVFFLGLVGVPVKQEYVSFLEDVLLPLHTSPVLSRFHRALTLVVVKFSNLEHVCAKKVFDGLFQYWPVSNSYMETLLLKEVEELLDNFTLGKRAPLENLLPWIASRLGSGNFQVAESALITLLREESVDYMKDEENSDVTIKVMYELEKDSVHAWENNFRSIKGKLFESLQGLHGGKMGEKYKGYLEKCRAREKKTKELLEEVGSMKVGEGERRVLDV